MVFNAALTLSYWANRIGELTSPIEYWVTSTAKNIYPEVIPSGIEYNLFPNFDNHIALNVENSEIVQNSQFVIPTAEVNNQKIKQTVARYVCLGSARTLLNFTTLDERQNEKMIKAFFVLLRNDDYHQPSDNDDYNQPSDKLLKRTQTQQAFHDSFENIIRKHHGNRFSDTQRIELENLVWEYFQNQYKTITEKDLSITEKSKLWIIHRLSFFYILDVTESLSWKLIDWSRCFSEGNHNQKFKTLMESLLSQFSEFFTKIFREREKEEAIGDSGGVAKHFEHFFKGIERDPNNPQLFRKNNLYTIKERSVRLSEIRTVFCRNLLENLPRYSLANQSTRILNYYWESLPHFNPEVKHIATVAFQVFSFITYYSCKLVDKLIELALFYFFFEKIVTKFSETVSQKFSENMDENDNFRCSLNRGIIIACEKIKEIMKKPVTLRDSHITTVDPKKIEHFIDTFLSLIENGTLEENSSRNRVLDGPYHVPVPVLQTKNLLSAQISTVLARFFGCFSSDAEVEKLIDFSLHGATRFFQSDRKPLSHQEQHELEEKRKNTLNDLLHSSIEDAANKVTGEDQEIIHERYKQVIRFFMDPIYQKLSLIYQEIKTYRDQIKNNPPDAIETYKHLMLKLKGLCHHLQSVQHIPDDLKDTPDKFKESLRECLENCYKLIHTLEQTLNDDNKLFSKQGTLMNDIESFNLWKEFREKFLPKNGITDAYLKSLSFPDSLFKRLHEHTHNVAIPFITKLKDIHALYLRRKRLQDEFDLDGFITEQSRLRVIQKASFFDKVRFRFDRAWIALLGGSVNVLILRDNLSDDEYQELENLIQTFQTCTDQKLENIQSKLRKKISSLQVKYKQQKQSEIDTPIQELVQNLNSNLLVRQYRLMESINSDRNEIIAIIDSTRDQYFNSITQKMNSLEIPNGYDKATKIMGGTRAAAFVGTTTIFGLGFLALIAAGATFPKVFNFAAKPLTRKGITETYYYWVNRYIERIIALSHDKNFSKAMATNLMHFANQHIVKA